jgi:hypothetical protein
MRHTRYLSVIFTAFMIGLGAATAWAEIGQIKNLSGEVFLLRNNQQQAAKAGDILQQSDTLITGANGSVGITLIDNSRLSAGPNSRLELKQFRYNPTTQEGEFLADMQRGTLAIVSGQIAKRSPDAMKVKTPTSILGVRGTTFVVKVEEE